MACTSGVQSRRSAFQAHAAWFPTGWCGAANAHAVDRQLMGDARRCQSHRPAHCDLSRLRSWASGCPRPGSWCGDSYVQKRP
jgi:hypothetical protein